MEKEVQDLLRRIIALEQLTHLLVQQMAGITEHLVKLNKYLEEKENDRNDNR